jgi:hypothetical protein
MRVGPWVKIILLSQYAGGPMSEKYYYIPIVKVSPWTKNYNILQCKLWVQRDKYVAGCPIGLSAGCMSM